ncbi:acyl-CoA N-acyltransferase [Dacryopinax primogenitus]|uniref:Acyl-CoA N-acyltransferase n=1 Tax=Dacryopinax primogenitus (strain DJM 731) TaxID=1858805 RepID=M5GD18_DACPD|nr:acyl-CoA N-acyltransferase [Dacryopinax primogenitus]EJU06565.1 acyl-CoA N-acyltransferase [Dacryopinax primogenitus]
MSGLRPFSILSTRVYIRRFLLGEVDNYVAIRNDPYILQYLPWWSALSSSDAWTQMTRQAVVNPGTLGVEAHMAVVDRQTNALIGICFIKVDPTGQQAELGVMITPSWQGRSYEQETIRALANWARTAPDAPRVQRLTITVDARNTAALSAFGASGFSMVSQGLWAGRFPYYIVAM